jgi:hypothetical protein
MIRTIKIIILISIISLSTGLMRVSAHHNANLPEGVDPLWRGIELYSYHNDAVEHSLEMRQAENTMNSDFGTAMGQGSQDSTQTQSGSMSRSNQWNQ